MHSFPQEWEYDFSSLKKCDFCGERSTIVDDMVKVEKITNREPVILCFCSQRCANEWYLEYLRRNEK